MEYFFYLKNKQQFKMQIETSILQIEIIQHQIQ